MKKDTTAPVLSGLPATVTLGCNAAVPSANAGAITVTDSCSSGLSATHAGDQTSLAGCVETTTRTYEAVDGCGNRGTLVQTITRTVDTTAPVLSGLPATVTLGCNAAVPSANAGAITVTDSCSSGLIATHPGEKSSLVRCVKTSRSTYEAVDGCGN